MSKGRAESIQQRCLPRGDEVPVRGPYGVLCYRFMLESRVEDELGEVEGRGSGRVACE